MNRVHTDRGTLLYLKEKFGIKTMIDLGCGPGDMVRIACDRGIKAIGIDGDYTLADEWKSKGIDVILHDFTKGGLELDKRYDLCYSVEFLEHVEEDYQKNYMEVFQKCCYVVCTAAPPGYTGHHHVNCRDQDYWVSVFDQYGFDFNLSETRSIRSESTMRKPFLQTTGMFFRNRQSWTF